MSNHKRIKKRTSEISIKGILKSNIYYWKKQLEIRSIVMYGKNLNGYIIDGKFYSHNGKVGINYKTDQTTFRPSNLIKNLILKYDS